MSATLNHLGTVGALEEIKKSLMPEMKTHQEMLRDDDYDNRWNDWDNTELAYDNSTHDKDRDHLWLDECKLAFSPLADTFIVGRGQVVAIYQSKTTPSGMEKDAIKFELVYVTNLPELEKDETITTLQLLPFVSQQKTSASLHDWTAILVGFSSGYFRIYTENGKPLIAHIFHDEPILKVRCRTYTTNALLSDQIDEILVVYPSAVVQIDGFSLYQTLRSNRQQIASGASSVTSNDANQFTFHKWRFERDHNGQQQDCVDVCNYVRNDYDALVLHSLTARPLTNDRANLFFTTGVDPYIGFYRAQEGATHTIMGVLSQALFAKMKNVFSMFGSGNGAASETKQDQREKIKPPTSVECSLALYDQRLGTCIALSPNRRMAAVVDDFGRVILFDTANGIAVRIWKGYRRAQVGWVVVDEDKTAEEHAKQANFLVIYAPKRGILEIWCTQNGPRVAAFNVGKHCRLTYLHHSIIGLNHLILHNLRSKMSAIEFKNIFAQSKCFLFDYASGDVSHVQVSFLCALTDRNSKRTCDLHVLKDIRLLIAARGDNLAEDKWQDYTAKLVKLMLMLKTSEMKRTFLEEIIKITGERSEEIIDHLAASLRLQLLKAAELAELDFEGKLVAQMASRIGQLCRFYGRIKEKRKALAEKASKMVRQSREQAPDISSLVEQLGGWSGNDVTRLLSLLAYRSSVLKTPLMEEEANFRKEVEFDFELAELLAHFSLWYSHLVKRNGVEIYDNLPIEIILLNAKSLEAGETNVQVVDLARLARFLFNAIFITEEDDQIKFDVSELLDQCCIFPSNLLLLIFTAWVHSTHSNHWRCWTNFSRALLSIVDVINDMRQDDDDDGDGEGREDNQDNDKHRLWFDCFDDRLLSPSWSDIIELIYESSNITSALVGVNMIKALINRFKLNKQDVCELRLTHKDGEDDDDDDDAGSLDQDENKSKAGANSTISSDNEWETLHLDKENLNLLTKQLEDLFLLDMLLKSNLFVAKPSEQQSSGNERKLNLNVEASDSNREEISLSFILDKGPGIISEIVARWVVNHRIEAAFLVCSPSQEAEAIEDEKRRINVGQDSTELTSTALADITELIDKETLMDMLEHVRRCFPNCLDTDILLINCFWEIMVRWHRQPQVYTYDLSLALSYLDRVFSAVLRHNVACMAWSIFIQKRLETLTGLIEKMGKKPKDRIARKEMCMDENQLEQFASFVVDVLDFMIRNSLSSHSEPVPVYVVDDWWSGFNAPANTGPAIQDDDEFVPSANPNIALSTMVMNQKTPNIDLLVEYYHLALVIQFTVIFNLHRAHPLSLFPSTVRAYLFKGLYDFITTNTSTNIIDPSQSMHIDPVLTETRKKFIFATVTAIVQSLPVYTGAHTDRDEVHKFYVAGSQWFEKLITLAREWNMNIDSIRARYVHDLFLFGVDLLAFDVMPMVVDKRAMARLLLTIAGARVLHHLQQHFDSLDEVSFLSLNVILWLKAIMVDGHCKVDAPLGSTVSLLHRLVEFLSDDMGNSRIAQELLVAVERQFD